jgi:hypothetical protein
LVSSPGSIKSPNFVMYHPNAGGVDRCNFSTHSSPNFVMY